MASPVTIAVLGAGRIGRLHAAHLAHRLPAARLVAVADVNLAAAERCAAELGVQAAYDDPRKVLDDRSIEAVVICTSTDTHARLIEECARAGKHVFCEKPIDDDLGRIDRALAAAGDARVKLQIGFNRRFDPGFRSVREQVASGAIGPVHIVRVTSRDPGPPPIQYVRVSGGLFLDMAIHDFDMVRYLVGSEVEALYAVGAVRVDPAIGEAGDVDTAIVTLEFEGGAIGTIDNSRKAVYGYDQRIEVFGAGGMLWADNMTPHRTGLADVSGVHGPLPLHFFLERYTESFLAEMASFLECIRKDTTPLVTGADGRAPVVMALAAERSRRERRRVELREIG